MNTVITPPKPIVSAAPSCENKEKRDRENSILWKHLRVTSLYQKPEMKTTGGKVDPYQLKRVIYYST